jgi:hypothetical protein
MAPERMVQPKLSLRVFFGDFKPKANKSDSLSKVIEFELRNLRIYRCSSAAARSYRECNYC